MTSIFQYARQTQDEQPEDVAPIFKEIKEHKQSQIIPPIGIADPKIIDAYNQNIANEDEILGHIADIEAYNTETKPQTALREVVSHGARAAEGFLGGVNSLINAFTPIDFENPDVGLPNASKLREQTKKYTGNYLEPKNEGGEIGQEIAGDIGSMFSTGGLSAIAKVLLPVGGQLIKQIVKSTGSGETAQDLSKLGFMGLASLANLGNAPRIASQAIRDAEAMIPVGLRISASPTQQALNRIRNSTWFRTGGTASKNPAIAEIQRIEAQIQNGTIDLHTSMQLRKDLNEARKQLGGFQLNQPVDKAQALRHLDEVDQALLQSMENYGQRANPNWWNNYNRANEAYRITQRSRTLSDFVQKHASKPLKSETAKILMHVGGGALATQLPTIAVAGLPAVALAKTIQVGNRMIQSPILRNHYLNVLRAAGTGNAQVMNKALQKFDEAALMMEGKANNNLPQPRQ